MARKTTASAPAADHEAPEHAIARAHYVSDVLAKADDVVHHTRKLAKEAPQRIKRADAALKKAGVSPNSDSLDHYHAVERILHEAAFYPPHDKRKESAEYKKIHDQMVTKEDKPCLVCGVRKSTLSDPKKNPFGAVQLETHHHIIEWALANAIDADKFNTHIVGNIAKRDSKKYGKPFTQQQILDWVDHDPDNLWVLCDVHHRHKFVGIHAITFPIWGPQDIVNAEILSRMSAQAAKG